MERLCNLPHGHEGYKSKTFAVPIGGEWFGITMAFITQRGCTPKKAHRPQSGAVRKILYAMPDLRQQGLAGLGQLFLLGLGLGEVLALGGEVGLDLRLG